MSRCEDEQMWRWADVKMRRCEDGKVWRWADVKMSRCEDEQMWRWADVKMRRCEDKKMWRWADVKMSRCEDEQMWRWADVKMRRCEDGKVWRWADVKMGRCEDEKMWRWEGVKMSRCEDEQMWRWADVKMSRCEDEKMWRWADVKMSRCEDEQMWRWVDVKMSRCEDEHMWRWEDVKMRGCEDEQMWRWEDVKLRCEDEMWRWEDVLQTPTIGRTLRSDALGNKHEMFLQMTIHTCKGFLPKGDDNDDENDDDDDDDDDDDWWWYAYSPYSFCRRMKRCTKAWAYKKKTCFPHCFCTHLLLQKCLWTGIFFERRLVHPDSDASKHRCLCTEVSTHIYTHDFTQKTLYTQEVSTHRSSTSARQVLMHRKLWRTTAFTHRILEMLLHAGSFTNGKSTQKVVACFCTLVPLRTDAFTYRSSYTLAPLHTSLFTQVHLSTDAFPDGRIHTRGFKRHQATTHRRFYTQNPLDREALTRRFCYQLKFLGKESRLWHITILHRSCAIHAGSFPNERLYTGNFFMQKCLHRESSRHRSFYTQMMLLRTQAPTCSYTEKGGQCAEEKLRRCAFDIFSAQTPLWFYHSRRSGELKLKKERWRNKRQKERQGDQPHHVGEWPVVTSVPKK